MSSMPATRVAPLAPSPMPSKEQRRQAIEALYATAYWLLSRARPHDAADVFRAMAFFAPADERGWLGLGTAHEHMDQPNLAVEMYGVGFAMAGSVRCELARARALRAVGQDDAATEALIRAEVAADEKDDDDLRRLVREEARE